MQEHKAYVSISTECQSSRDENGLQVKATNTSLHQPLHTPRADRRCFVWHGDGSKSCRAAQVSMEQRTTGTALCLTVFHTRITSSHRREAESSHTSRTTPRLSCAGSPTMQPSGNRAGESLLPVWAEPEHCSTARKVISILTTACSKWLTQTKHSTVLTQLQLTSYHKCTRSAIPQVSFVYFRWQQLSISFSKYNDPRLHMLHFNLQKLSSSKSFLCI